MRSNEIVALLVIVIVMITTIVTISTSIGPAFFDTFFDIIGATIAVLRVPILLSLVVGAVIVFLGKARFF